LIVVGSAGRCDVAVVCCFLFLLFSYFVVCCLIWSVVLLLSLWLGTGCFGALPQSLVARRVMVLLFVTLLFFVVGVAWLVGGSDCWYSKTPM
jgi:hypothetical protein